MFCAAEVPALQGAPVAPATRLGVIYRPKTKRWSHHSHVRLPEQFDTIIHLDETRAIAPLERTSDWDAGELPETYPEGV